MRSYKIALLGKTSVGKTSILDRLTRNKFSVYQCSTVGAAYITFIPTYDRTVKLCIWDTAGQERYKSLAPMYYKNADCAIIVYDITEPSSLNVAKYWINELEQKAEKTNIVLVGNKTDLIKKYTRNTYDNNCIYKHFETSAYTGEGIYDVFNYVIKIVKENDNNDDKIVTLNKITKKKKCCPIM